MTASGGFDKTTGWSSGWCGDERCWPKHLYVVAAYGFSSGADASLFFFFFFSEYISHSHTLAHTHTHTRTHPHRH